MALEQELAAGLAERAADIHRFLDAGNKRRTATAS
jgi:hypothetical protein